MRQRLSILFVCALLGTGCAPPEPTPPAAPSGRPAAVPPPIGVSGIAPLSDRLFLVVHDTKRGENAPRVAAVALDEVGVPDYRPLSVDWSGADAVPSDVEAIAAVPHAPGHFLAVESGPSDGVAARVLHLRASGARLENVAVRLVDTIELPPGVHNLEGATLLSRPEGGFVLLLCERDERKVELERPPAEGRFVLLRWAPIDLDRRRLETPLRSTRIRTSIWPEGEKLRTCSDLHLAGRTLWIAATVDPEGGGRFDSIVYRTSLDRRTLDEGREPVMKVAWRVRDSKVEALASAPFPDAGLIIGTDEDERGGTVRLLPGLD